MGRENASVNLSALLSAVIDKLRNENKIYIFCEIPSHLNVLFRNGFFNHLLQKQSTTVDNRDSTIPLKIFNASDDDRFVRYLKVDFFGHKGLSELPDQIIRNLKTAFQEIFVNVEFHADTTRVYTCGQYFPNKNVLKFTLLDLGNGFLKKIRLRTDGTISKDIDAIDWAVKPGNSTKDRSFGPGGYGLNDILNYCRSNNGSIHIVSGLGYWSMSGKQFTNYRIDQPFPGSMIHLIFRKI